MTWDKTWHLTLRSPNSKSFNWLYCSRNYCNKSLDSFTPSHTHTSLILFNIYIMNSLLHSSACHSYKRQLAGERCTPHDEHKEENTDRYAFPPTDQWNFSFNMLPSTLHILVSKSYVFVTSFILYFISRRKFRYSAARTARGWKILVTGMLAVVRWCWWW